MTDLNNRDLLHDRLKEERSKKRIPFIQKSSRELAENMLEENKKSPGYKKERIQKFVDLLENSEWKLTKKLNSDIANDLIIDWKQKYIIDYSDKFIFDENVLKTFILNEGSYKSYSNLNKIIDNIPGFFNKNIIDFLIDKRCGWIIPEYINKFSWVNHQEIADLLISNWYWWSVAEYLEKFEWVDHKKIAEKIFKMRRKNTSIDYVDNGGPYCIAKNLEKFKWVDHKEIVNLLIDNNHSDDVIRFIDNFKWIDHNEIVNKILDRHPWEMTIELLLENFHKFPSLKPSDFLKKLLYRWSTNVLRFLDKFEWIDHNEIVKMIIDCSKEANNPKDLIAPLIYNIESLQWLTNESYKNIIKELVSIR